jgi:ribosomal protein L9
MAGHIKKIGTHSAKVSLDHHVTATITLSVVAE